ncbi:MAG: Rieske 2Fe-2S domain-containing protein [Labilithrix sp.]|nr:Rieske 2Fe-2S domain-containing protein [Labilithrix sp.]MBX3223337.1 Rieske 2Fe-2S domain-containing protein [Labilithrix sp.]
MDRQRQIELVRRVLAHVEAKTTDTAEAAEALDVSAYSDEARIDREIQVLFRRLPIAVGHASELARPGDFITHDASGVPLLVVRRDDGGVDAFVNVCRHRGTRVEPAPRGNKRAFSCPYHGWTYGKRGQLVTIPHERGFACVDKTTRGLVRVAAGEAAGLVFVTPSPLSPDEDAALDARAWLGPLAADLEGFGVASSVSYAPRSVERALSWKLAIDIFLETYHLRPTHKETIYPMFFDNLGLVDRSGPHLRNVFPKRTIKELAHVPESTWTLRAHANVLFHLFPNTLVLVQPDHAAVLHVWPNGAGRATVTSYLLVPEPPDSEKARGYWDANAAVLYGATDEDFAMGESIQRGVASGANREVVFGAFEHALAHFHGTIAERTRDA